MTLTFGSLFAGIGGLDLGLERAGMTCSWQVEIDDYARRVLAKHWPHVRRHEDVRTFPPAGDWSVDLICGGDPCQENSAANQSGRCQQPSLGGEFIRIVAAIRPAIVLRENPTVVRAEAPWPWRRFRSELQRLGYSVLPFRLRACCFGAEHQRDRLFLLAVATDSISFRREWWMARPSEEKAGRAHAETAGRSRRTAEPGICRVSNGVPYRVDRLRGLGNAVVPQIAEWIGRRILESLK